MNATVERNAVKEIEYHGVSGYEFTDGTKVLLPYGSHIFKVLNANYDTIAYIDADGQIAEIVDLLREGHNPVIEKWEMEVVNND